MKTFIKLQHPFEWVRVDGKNVDAFGEVTTLDQYPVSEDSELIGVVPGEWVTVHNVAIPAKSKKQFMVALPYALEEALTEDVENMHFVCPNWKSGENCKVMVVSQQKMSEWQSLANEYKLPIEQLIPDHVLLPFHDVADYSLALSGDQLLTNQRNGFGATLDVDFLDIWLMDVPLASTIAVNDQQLAEKIISENPDRDVRHWPFGSKMAHWLEYLPELKFDLWGDKFRPSVRTLNWRAYALPVLIAAIAMVGKMAYDTYRYLDLHREIRSINSQMEEIITGTFPQIDYVEQGKEVRLMREAIASLGAVDSAKNLQSTLAEVSAVLGRQGVTVASMAYRDSRLEIVCELRNFSQVDQLTRQFNAQPSIKARLLSSSSDDGEIIASYTIENS